MIPRSRQILCVTSVPECRILRWWINRQCGSMMNYSTTLMLYACMLLKYRLLFWMNGRNFQARSRSRLWTAIGLSIGSQIVAPITLNNMPVYVTPRPTVPWKSPPVVRRSTERSANKETTMFLWTSWRSCSRETILFTSAQFQRLTYTSTYV